VIPRSPEPSETDVDLASRVKLATIRGSIIPVYSILDLLNPDQFVNFIRQSLTALKVSVKPVFIFSSGGPSPNRALFGAGRDRKQQDSLREDFHESPE